MLGGVFGDITGFAPGYTVSLSYWKLELFTQGEYFIDAANSEGNFFYTWSELSLAPVDWFRFGIVIDRTKAFGSELDIRRGPLIGVKYKNIDFTTYWLDPGSRSASRWRSRTFRQVGRRPGPRARCRAAPGPGPCRGGG